MTKYNVGKFNVKDTRDLSVSASTDIVLDSVIVKYLVNKYMQKMESSIAIDSKAYGHIELKGATGIADITMGAIAIASNLVYGYKSTGDLIIESNAIGSLLGEDYLEITGLSLKPGQEAEIDMCALTVTVNGVNAIHLMSADGDFFDFLVGDNDIEIEAVGGNGVKIDAYWKDRWL